MLILGRNDVERLLPMNECIEVAAGALAALACGEALQPLRQVHRLAGENGLLVVMPGALSGAGTAADGVHGVKVLSLFPGNAALGEDTHVGSVLLFESQRGAPVALLDAASLTAIRTAAVSAVATRLLAREDAGDLALLGAGVQAHTHLEALLHVRPLRRVRVWSRDPERARRFARTASGRHHLPVTPAATARQAVEGADLVCTLTGASEPVLEGGWLAPGAHVNAVGACTPNARELDTDAVRRSRLFVDRPIWDATTSSVASRPSPRRATC